MEGNNTTDGTSWWCLDEPFYRDDWYGIEYYAKILREVQDEMKTGYNVVFRADLSFAYIQFYYLDGLLDLCCAGSSLITDNPSQHKYRQQYFGEEFWTYGAGNFPVSTNMNSYATILMNYLKGSTGFLPWNSYAMYEHYEKPDSTALIYPAGRAGSIDPNVSLRLKIMRRALQDVEYLKMVEKKYGYDSEQMDQLLKGILNFNIEAQSIDLNVTAQTHRDRYFIDSINIRELALSLL